MVAAIADAGSPLRWDGLGADAGQFQDRRLQNPSGVRD
jgi:hypothetical protein